MKKIILIIWGLGLFATSALADIIHGRVIDATTNEGIPFAEVSIVIGAFAYDNLTDSLGHFMFVAKNDGLFFVNMLGYDGSDLIKFQVFSESRRDTVDVGDIKLHPLETLLKMVEVNARARRFTMSGDTIVFHPEAYHLEEGARLEELIMQLPGVSMDENGLSWNGRPLRIIMNGKDLFGGNAIVGMLPAEAVENIKAYNKASEFSQRTGKDDGGEDMVLDLNIKPGFLDRLYGDAKAIYQTPDRYEGEVVANRLSDHDPLMIYADANNRNRYIQHTIMSRGSGSDGYGFGLGQYGSFGYQHNWGTQDQGQTLQSFASATGLIDHNDHWGTNYKDTDNYLPGEASNRLFTSNRYHSHSLAPGFEGASRWQKDGRNTLWLNFSGKYGRQRGSQNEQTEQTMLTDSTATTDAMMMRSHTQDETASERIEADAKAGWMHYMPEGKGSVELTAKWNLTDNDGSGLTVREVEYPAQAGMDYTLRQDYQAHTNTNSTSVALEVKRWLTDRVLLTGKYNLGTTRKHDSRDMQTDMVNNAEDSYDDRLQSTKNNATLQSTINLRPFQFIPALQYTYLHEREDYQRGLLDTLARRDVQRLEPSLQARWRMKSGADLNLNYSMSTSEPQLLQTIAFRDATNPLFVTMGNPDLRNSHTHHANIGFSIQKPSRQLMFSASANYYHTDRAHATFLQYDPLTGTYFSRLENVRGDITYGAHSQYDQGYGNIFRLTNLFNFNMTKRYAPLMQAIGSGTGEVNCQHNAYLQNWTDFRADWKWLKVGAGIYLNISHLTNSSAQVQNTTLWNNRFEINGELRKGKFTDKTSLNEKMRRGYLTKGMNTDHFIWNASASWRCLKGKGTVELEVNDILNNADNFSSTETANQQISSWSDQMHHYAAISFTYHLDPKQKK